MWTIIYIYRGPIGGLPMLLLLLPLPRWRPDTMRAADAAAAKNAADARRDADAAAAERAAAGAAAAKNAAGAKRVANGCCCQGGRR